MKVLIVWAHPEEASFNGALVNAAEKALMKAGHDVRVTDLYRERFEPLATADDFERRVRTDRLVYDEEQLATVTGNTRFANDIDRSVENLFWCDFLILQFPLWWFSVPAIMKGWIDRVMVKGRTFGGGRWYDRGGLTGRKAMMSITTAAYPEMCAPPGINGAMDVILWPLQHGVLRFVGFQTVKPNIIWSATYIDDAKRAAAIEEYSARLTAIESEQPEPSHGRAEFGKNWQLLPDVEPLTIGQWRTDTGGKKL